MINMIRAIVLMLLLTLVFACDHSLKRRSDGNEVARVGDRYLYDSEIAQVMPKGLASRDSISLSRKYINDWIKLQLILQKANNNLPADQLDFSQQLETYKNSLIRYKYENVLIRQRLDPIVSDTEIESYYATNKDNFLLKSDIVIVNFVQLSQDSAKYIPLIKDLLFSDPQENKDELENLCKLHATDYFLEDNWITFNDLLNNIPITTYNQTNYLANNNRIVYSDSISDFLIHIIDYKIKEESSPLKFEKDNIHNIIVNKRKLELIKKMESDIFDQAMKNNEIEIYY
ncbi:MAG: hypothetical protein JEZ03_05285 [Bacteroidales bacterium]|nr:hypothetical protein [Bacteroidales bacterium]